MDTERLELADLRKGGNPRFNHPEAFLRGDLLDQSQGAFVGRLPGVHVPTDRADDLRPGFEGPIKIGLPEDLHHHIESLADGQGLQGLQAIGLQQGGNQQDGVGPEDLALLDLVLLEDEVAPKERDLHGAAGIRKMLILPEVEEPVGGHRDGPRTVLHQALGVGSGPIALAHLAPERIPPGHLADDGNA